MKRKILSLLLCLLIFSSLPLSVSALDSLPMVIDSAQLLTGSEEAELEETAQSLRAEYEMDIVILTVNSLSGKSAQDFSDDYFDENGYGYGENFSGVLFLLAISEREWYISTCGDAIYALTDYGIQQLGETIVPYLSGGDYYGAFCAYLDSLPYYLNAYQSGIPVDGHTHYSEDYYHGDRDTVVHYQNRQSPNIVLSLMIGVIVATVVILILRTQMNSKRPQRSASSYMKQGSYKLRMHQDLFLYSNVSKVRRQENHNNGNRGGGSSVHRSSGGRSHGGGGGRF